MLTIAIKLIGEKDAMEWWNKNQDLFNHPYFNCKFIPKIVYHFDNLQGIPYRSSPYDENIEKTFKKLGYNENTIWAHPHPDLYKCFGEYIVREGTKIIYKGRNEDEILSRLKL